MRVQVRLCVFVHNVHVELTGTVNHYSFLCFRNVRVPSCCVAEVVCL